jgi:hypothetical protein
MRLAVLTAIICAFCGTARAQESGLERPITADTPGAAVVWLPDAISSGVFAWRVAESAGVPLIFQGLPLDYRDPALVLQRVDLAGLTVRDAMDILVAQDPRYRWEERNRVIIIRPSSLATDPDDMLNRPMPAIKGSRVNLNDVLARATGAGFSPGAILPAAIDAKAFAIDAPSGTLLDVLIAAARAHGGVMWSAPDAVRGPDGGHSLGYRTFVHEADATSAGVVR